MASAQSTVQLPGALNVIFTCDICQASISDIYGKGGPGAHETDFQDGRPPTADRRVTCLWLTQCMHLTCGKHLEGGGAPFHPKGEHPKAPCPLCRQEKNDERPKTLYAIRGLRPGTFDPDIPELLFRVPPMKFDGQSVEREALQFQYLSLIRYATSMSHKHNGMERTIREIGSQAKRADSENAALAAENKALKDKMLSLEKAEADIGKWKERLPKVTHYLKQWPLVIEEVNQLRGRLVDLGYAVPKRDYAFRDAVAESLAQEADSSSSQLAMHGGDARTAKVLMGNTRTEYETAPTHISESSSGRKRKLAEYMNHGIASIHDQQPQRHRHEGRVPDTRGTVQEFVASDPADNLQTIQNPRRSNVLSSDPGNIHHQQTFEKGGRDEHLLEEEHQRVTQTPRLREHPGRPVEYLMTGGIPHSAKRSSLHTGVHQHGDAFPDEAEYHVYEKRNRSLQQSGFEQPPNRTILGGQSVANGSRQPDSWPSVPKIEVVRNQTRAHDFSVYSHRPERPKFHHHGPVTPPVRKNQNLGTPHVFGQHSSPFFSRVQGGVRSGLSPGVAGLSANARVGTVTKRVNAPMGPPAQGCTHSRSLNGLSFINVPRDQRLNQPLYQSSSAWAPQRSSANRSYIAHNPHPTNDGYFVRPEQPWLSSSYFHSAPQFHQKIRAHGPFQTPHIQSIRQHAPPTSTRKTFTRNDAISLLGNSNANSNPHGSTSFYQNQASGVGFRNFAGHESVEPRGLLSSTGGRRSIKR